MIEMNLSTEISRVFLEYASLFTNYSLKEIISYLTYVYIVS